jgi:MoaA/NifB/PqqE/SkfB family radical SAM enzyme
MAPRPQGVVPVTSVSNTMRRIANRKLNDAETKLKRTVFVSRPVNLILETTNRCNSWCVMCRHPTYRREQSVGFGDMSMDTFDRSRPFWSYATDVCLGGNGEPFLAANHLAMARELKRADVYVHTFSNGIVLEPALSNALIDVGYDLIHISLDGACAETYLRLRGVDTFDTVVTNLHALQEAKLKRRSTTPSVRFNITAMRSSLRELVGTVRLASEMGVEGVDVHHLDVYNDDSSSESPWHDPAEAKMHMAAAFEVGARLGIEVNLPSFDERSRLCTAPFRALDIHWDGVVATCPGYRFLVGDLTRQPPSEVWNGEAIRSVRERVWRQGYESVCPGCTAWSQRGIDYLGLTGRPVTEDLRDALQ